MPYKVTIIMDDIPLSLGSILMTQGIREARIDTISNVQVKLEQSDERPKVALLQAIKEKNLHRSIAQRNKFKHPSGKTSADFIVEFLERSGKIERRADLQKFLMKVGFSDSTVNNALRRALEFGNVIQTGKASYQINPDRKRDHQ